MCGLCGSFTEIHWSTGASLPARPAAERAALARHVARIAAKSGVSVAPFATGFRVSGPTGRTEIVADLGALWAAVDRLGRTRLDPLDERLLAKLEAPS